MALAICSLTEVILINGKNIGNLVLAIDVAAIATLVGHESDVSRPSDSRFRSGHLKICFSSTSHATMQVEEAGTAFGDTGSSNPGICHWEQMSPRPTSWITANMSPTTRKLHSCFFSFFLSFFHGLQLPRDFQ